MLGKKKISDQSSKPGADSDDDMDNTKSNTQITDSISKKQYLQPLKDAKHGIEPHVISQYKADAKYLRDNIPQYSLNETQYVVFDTAQVKVKYIVHLRNY